MRILLVLVALAIVALAGPARADDRAEARRWFASGQAADKAGNYAEAIEHYLRANELVPHHFAVFNIATDHERLGQLRDAARWFTRYLEAPQASDRDRVQRLIVELRLRPAQLTVRSSPGGARVLIDGQPVGVTPYIKAIRGGGHRVVVELDGQSEERDVTLEFGEPREIDVTLGAAGGRDSTGSGPTMGTLLDVQGSPRGAFVMVDDAYVGRLPVRVPVSPGAHRVKLTSAGFAAVEIAAFAVDDQAIPVNIVLQRDTTPARPAIRLAYLFGASSGVDASAKGALALAELGVRVLQFDVSTRVGKTFSGLDALSVELLVRWTMTKTRLAPFIGVGFSAIGHGLGYELLGGMRFDLSRTERFGASLLVDLGVRGYVVEVEDPETMMTEIETGRLYPLMVSLQLLWGR